MPARSRLLVDADWMNEWDSEELKLKGKKLYWKFDPSCKPSELTIRFRAFFISRSQIICCHFSKFFISIGLIWWVFSGPEDKLPAHVFIQHAFLEHLPYIRIRYSHNYRVKQGPLLKGIQNQVRTMRCAVILTQSEVPVSWDAPCQGVKLL